MSWHPWSTSSWGRSGGPDGPRQEAGLEPRGFPDEAVPGAAPRHRAGRRDGILGEDCPVVARGPDRRSPRRVGPPAPERSGVDGPPLAPLENPPAPPRGGPPRARATRRTGGGTLGL